MYGAPIEAVRNAMQVLLSELQSDPHALETAYLSIITFDNTANQVVPLTPILQVQLPEIEASGCTALGEALELLADKLEKDIHKNSPQAKGDWKPLVFLMTDGAPTDDITNGVAKIKKAKTGTFIACGAGPDADIDILKQFTENVVRLDALDPAQIRSFIKWISSSIKVTSQHPGEERSGLSALPEPPETISIV